jgi:hypothetical protein
MGKKRGEGGFRLLPDLFEFQKFTQKGSRLVRIVSTWTSPLPIPSLYGYSRLSHPLNWEGGSGRVCPPRRVRTSYVRLGKGALSLLL